MIATDKIGLSMNKFSFFLARRFLRAASSEHAISVMIIICLVGIFISTFALALAAAIMNGLERATKEKLQGVHADLIIRSYRSLDSAKIDTILTTEFAGVIAAASPRRFGHGILFNEQEQDMTCPVVVIGVDPDREQAMSGINAMVQEPREHNSLPEILTQNAILIGSAKLQELDKKRGDTITIFFAAGEQRSKKKLTLGQEQATIAGVFKTGMEEVDNRLILVNTTFFDELFPNNEINEIGLKLAQGADTEKVKKLLADRLQLDIISWQDLYPGLTSAMLLERYVALCIMALIALVASMNIVALLFMYITHKQSDIAILKAMGMANGAIEQTFIALALTITIIGTGLGLVLASLVSFLLDHYKLITLPDVYYTTHVPADMSFSIIGGIVLLVIIMSLAAAWIPVRRVRTISVAQVLKFEA